MVILILRINAVYKKEERNKNIFKIIERDNEDHIKTDNLSEIKNYVKNKDTNSSSWIRNGDPLYMNGKIFPRVEFKIQEISNWPEKTFIKCWNCTRNFKNPPIGIPVKYLDGVFYLKGCFCSFKCANSWLFHYEKRDVKWENETMLNLLYEKMGNFGPIGYAPPKEIMKCFGGIVSDTEYERILQCKILVNVRDIMLVSISPNFDPFFLTDDDIISNNIDSGVEISGHVGDVGEDDTIMKIKSDKRSKRVFRKKPLRNNSKLDNIFK